jgi:hypothetical protein
MSNNHHTPHAFGAPLTAVEMDRPHGELDAAIDSVIATGSGASTTLTAQANAGQKNLVVASGVGFANGDVFWIGDAGGTFESGVVASGGGTGTLVAVANLTNTYAIGKPVSKSPIELVDARGGSATLGARLNALGIKAVAAVKTTTDLVVIGSQDGAGAADQHLNSIAGDGQSALTGAYSNGHLWRTVDKGLIWRDMGQVGTSVDDVMALASKGPGTFFAGCSMTGTPAALFRSGDGGISWVKVFQAATTAEATEGFSIEDGPGKTLLIGSANQVAGAGAKIWRSTDGGISWANVLTVATKTTIRKIKQLTNGNFIAGIRGAAPNEVAIYRSTDDGATWAVAQTIAGDEIWSMLPLPGAIVLLGMNTGTIWRSFGGVVYTQVADLSVGPGASVVFGLTRVGRTVLAFVTQNANATFRVYASEDEGLTWTEVGSLNAAYHYHDPLAVDSRTILLPGSSNSAGAMRIYRGTWYG